MPGMKLALKDKSGRNQGELEVGFDVIQDRKGTQAVHETVVAYQAAQRQGNASTKTRGEVNKSNKKPWRQKGTGRARAGSHASPLWGGGGIVFGPRPRDYTKKVSRKTKLLAFRKALSERLLAEEVTVLDQLTVDQPKTKELAAVLAALELKGSILLVVDGTDERLLLAARNLPRVTVTTGDTLNVYDVLRPDHLVFSQAAFQKAQERINR